MSIRGRTQDWKGWSVFVQGSRINAEPAGPRHVHPSGTRRAKIVAQGSAEVADADADATRSETGAGERVVHSLHTRLTSDSPKGGWQQ